MPPTPRVPPPGSHPRPKEDLSHLLREAVRHSVQIEREASVAAVPKTSRAKPIAVGLFCALSLGFCAWSFIARPAFIWGTPPVAIPAQRAEAGVRLAMYLQARRLDLYREREGEYPERLRDVGGDTALGYRRIDDTHFALAATVGNRQLVLTSDADREAFLGNSRDLVQQKVGR